MKRFNVLVSLSVCAVLLMSAPALADTLQIPGGAYIYDFNGLTGGANLAGQDNWTGTSGLKVKTSPDGGNQHPGDGLCTTVYGGTGEYYMNRANDSNWSFDLSGQSQFAFGFSLTTDYGVSGYYGFGMTGIKNSVSGKMIRFGIQIQPWFYAVELYNAAGTKYTGGQPRPTAINQKWYFKCEVDTTANGGEGSASVYTWRPGTHTTWQAVANVQNINMLLDTQAADILNADTLHHRIKTRLIAGDDIWVTPEPATMALLGLGGIGLLLRRRRR
ncbi:MAG: PEP-CTERM sorting domain-containing protein [Planctomycetota bacterium]